MKKKLGAIVLAAGKGTRMESKKVNKVTLPLGGKPMIIHTAELLRDVNASPIILVVGFAKSSVKNLFSNDIIFAEQRRRLGTAHAVSAGLKELPEDAEDVLILQGDDSAFYRKDIIEKLLIKHKKHNAAFTFLTIQVDNPLGLGRIVRDKKGKLLGIIEEKDASILQKKINEINPACYIANVAFLKKYLPKVEKSSVTGEYYLTSLIDIGIKNREDIETFQAGNIAWRGVNTREELQKANELLKSIR